MKRLALAVAVVALLGAPRAQEAAPAAEPTLEAITVDGLRACQSIIAGRSAADAAVIFGFTANAATLSHETVKGLVEVLPPDAERRSCRVQISALTIDYEPMIDAVKTFLTTPPQSYAPLQMRIAERLGTYAARTSIWASRSTGGLSMVTFYEILANEYYHGPKVMIDAIFDAQR